MANQRSQRVLVLNTGSSSVKYQLIELPSETVLDKGQRERVGVVAGDFDTHQDAVRDIVESLPEALAPDVVGHRVVHGGERFSAPTLIDDEVVTALVELSSLAPLHNPPSIEGIKGISEAMPRTPQVAVFDTAFFADLPPEATDYTLPREIQHKYGLKKYGFHGSSHEYVAHRVQELLPGASAESRMVVFHLGNGSSVTAVRGTRPVDTSMGFTPLPGLVMGTRSGDIDASVALHLINEGGLSPEEVTTMVTTQSGLLGMSGVSDMRDLATRAEAGDESAVHAINVWVWRAKHYLGAYAAQLSGLDALVFTGGIGENQSTLRARITEHMGFLGIDLDTERNHSSESGARRISSAESTVEVWVIPTNEELHIARFAARAV